MNELAQLMKDLICNNGLIQIVLSNVKKGVQKEYNKVNIAPFIKKEEIFYNIEYVYDKKVLHKNIRGEQLSDEVVELMKSYFKNTTIFSKDADYQVLTSKSGNVKIIKAKPTKKETQIFDHNRKKQYILEENTYVDFLVYLEVMNKEGRIYDKRRDKFKQINKFLEIVEDAVKDMDNSKILNIVDFGCGKAYLTFALYYYLVKLKNYKVNIIGLDIKQDVIDFCNKVARELGYVGLKFEIGEIRNFTEIDSVDMMVTLHACDTATDDALIKAIKWNTKIILSVPCCQHELFNQIDNPIMKPLLKHGLIKERLSALITDSVRVKLLEAIGYNVAVIEFIDIEHTPKNLMIKAVKIRESMDDKLLAEYNSFKDFWGIYPHMEKYLK